MSKFPYEYESEAEFDGKITEPFNRKIQALRELLNRVKDLPEAYKSKAENLVEDEIARMKERLLKAFDGGRINSRLIASVLEMSRLNFDSLLQIHQKVSDLQKLADALPVNLATVFRADISDAENRMIDNFPSSDFDYLDFVKERIEVWGSDPTLAFFALDRVGQIGLPVSFFEKIKIYKDDFDKLATIIDTATKNRELFAKYPEFIDLNEFYNQISAFQAIDARLKNARNYDEVLQILRAAETLSRQIKDLGVDSEYLRLIEQFDREIGLNLPSSQKSVITRLYHMLLIRGDMSFDTFSSRVRDYKKIYDNLSKLEALNPSGREKYAKNAAQTLENFIVEHVIQNGIDAVELESMIRDNYEKTKASANVTINIGSKALLGVFKHGSFKSYEELETLHRENGLFGKTGYGQRRSDRDMSMQYQDKFIVGALGSENGFDEIIGPAPFYGHGVVKLKSAAIDARVNFYEGDSLSPAELAKNVNPNWLMRKWDNAESRKLDISGAILSKSLMDLHLKIRGFTHAHTMYIEAHIVGGVNISDIQSITYGIVEQSDRITALKNLATDGVQDNREFAEYQLRALRTQNGERQKILDELNEQAALAGIPFKIQKLEREIKPVEDPFRPGAFKNQLSNDEGY